MKGTVKFFNQKKGFGFITGEDGKDYFVHITALPAGVFLKDNQEVTFDTEETQRGMQARNIVVGNEVRNNDSSTQDQNFSENNESEGNSSEEEPVSKEMDSEEF